MDLKKLYELKNSISNAIAMGIEGVKEVDEEKSLLDFKERKKDYYNKVITSSVGAVKEELARSDFLIKFNEKNEEIIEELKKIQLNDKDLNELKNSVDKMIEISKNLILPGPEKKIAIPKNIPKEIYEDIFNKINSYFSFCWIWVNKYLIITIIFYSCNFNIVAFRGI